MLGFEPDEKYISGSNLIRYTVLEEQQRLQRPTTALKLIEKVYPRWRTLKNRNRMECKHFKSLAKKPQLKGRW